MSTPPQPATMSAAAPARADDVVMRGDRKIAFVVDGEFKRDVPVFI